MRRTPLYVILLIACVCVLPAGVTFADDTGDPPGAEQFCDGDPHHYEHDIPVIDMSACQLQENIHFPGWTNENPCFNGSKVSDCTGCFGCCNGKFDEKTNCHCASLGPWGAPRRTCNKTADIRRGECQAQCGIPFNNCDPEGDREFRFPNP